MNALESLIATGFEGAMSYREYRELIHKLHAENKVTGANQSEELLAYSKMNDTRMDRWDKHTKLAEATIEAIKSDKRKLDILVITEGWCGDSAQIAPVVEQIINQNPNWKSHFILRDDNLEIMDMFLTNGKTRSIPMFVFLENGVVVGKFGPRPEAGQMAMDAAKASGADSHEAKEKLHLWYARDKHQAIEKEFLQAVSYKP
jgi:hypothetical protein